MGKGARVTRSAPVRWTFPLERRNWLIIGAGIVLLGLGYGLMAVGIVTRYDHPLALVVAPIVLVVAYLVVIPYGILKRWSSSGSGDASQ